MQKIKVNLKDYVNYGVQALKLKWEGNDNSVKRIIKNIKIKERFYLILNKADEYVRKHRKDAQMTFSVMENQINENLNEAWKSLQPKETSVKSK